MTNQQIARTLEQLADLLEIQGADSFRLRAYRSAADAINESAESISDLVKQGADLTTISGIGKSVAQKCKELVETGSLQQFDEIRQDIPLSVLELLRIPKLGPKKVAVLFKELGIVDLEQLKEACESGRVRSVTGFTAKSEQSILAGMDLALSAGKRIYWAAASELASELRVYLETCAEVESLEFAGSFRRGKETIGNLDVLIVSSSPAMVMDRCSAFERVEKTLERLDDRISLRIDQGFLIEIRFVSRESLGSALQHLTGSHEHNRQLSQIAAGLQLKTTPRGVFRIVGDRDVMVAGQTEEEVYRAVNLPWIPPELREGRREFEWAAANALPQLLELADIKGDLHMHTTASDGTASIRDMVAAAKLRGLHYIAITDHSKRVSLARGLDALRLREQWAQIDKINQELSDFTIFKGIECDILENGQMDLEDDVLAEADWVLASIHYGQDQPTEQITRRILNAIENPHVDVIAHPTGRLLNRRKAYDVAMDELFSAAAAKKKRLELNANPARLDLHDEHCARARELGIPIVINSDAHSPDGLDVMRFGVMQARRGGLSKSQVFNTLDLESMRKTLRAGSQEL